MCDMIVFVFIFLRGSYLPAVLNDKVVKISSLLFINNKKVSLFGVCKQIREAFK